MVCVGVVCVEKEGQAMGRLEPVDVERPEQDTGKHEDGQPVDRKAMRLGRGQHRRSDNHKSQSNSTKALVAE